MRTNQSNFEMQRLQAQVTALEQLLDVHERAVIEKSAELERALDELREKTRKLAHSNAELEQFAYAASHDLQEPLRMVASYCQLLEGRLKDKLDEETTTFLWFAVDGATRMQSLINDLLTLSRLGRAAGPFKPTDCSAAVDHAVANLQAVIHDRGAIVTRDALPTMPGDATQLTQLFQNLIGNAIKYCETNLPTVHVAAQAGDREWTLSVRDNGIGIAPEYFERIFLIFQRLHEREKYPGTGIGLAICKKIVQHHGGRIWVESEPGHGSVFCFTLPAG